MSEENKLAKYGYPAFIVIALGLAGYITFATLMAKPINEMPDKIEAASPFACTSCTWTGLLTPRQQALQQMKGLHVERASTKDGHSTSFRVLTLACPQCEKVAARVGSQCPACDAIFFGTVCTKCGRDMNAPTDTPAESPVESEMQSAPEELADLPQQS